MLKSYFSHIDFVRVMCW